MVDSKVTNEWLAKAEEDFGFASLNLADKTNDYFDQICFHFQQASEKYLKTYIVAKELGLQKIHNLEILRKTCLKAGLEFEDIHDECISLNAYYVDTRYPTLWPSKSTRNGAEEAKAMAKKIGDLVKKLLQDEGLI